MATTTTTKTPSARARRATAGLPATTKPRNATWQCPYCQAWLAGGREDTHLPHIRTEHPEQWAKTYAPKERERKAANAAARKESKGKAAKPAKERKPKREPQECGCGCGAQAAREFMQGHDARLRGRIVRAIEANRKTGAGDVAFDIFSVEMAARMKTPAVLAAFHHAMFASFVTTAGARGANVEEEQKEGNAE